MIFQFFKAIIYSEIRRKILRFLKIHVFVNYFYNYRYDMYMIKIRIKLCIIRPDSQFFCNISSLHIYHRVYRDKSESIDLVYVLRCNIF